MFRFLRKTVLLSVVPLSAVIGLVSVEARAETFKMKIASVTTNDIIHEYMREFEKRIEAKTNGQIEATLYPGGQLGGLARQLEGVQLGTIEMYLLASVHLKGVDERYQSVDVPGLFTDIPHSNRTLQDPRFRDTYLGLAEKKGIKGISLFTYGITGYASDRAIRKLDDFKGLKIRSKATDIENALMQSVGATGIETPWMEILPSLQRGAIDAVRTDTALMAPMKFYLGGKYLTLTHEGLTPVIAIASMTFFNKLPPDLQKTLLDVGREIEPYMEKVSLEYNATAEKAWVENGGEIIRLSEAEQAEFMKRARSVGEKVFAQAKPDVKGVYDLFSKIATERLKK